jgi:hypothetical protein
MYIIRDNEWTGWLRRMRTCFEQGKISEYWEGGLELEKWFDPAFEDFIDNEQPSYIFIRRNKLTQSQNYRYWK